ncbi:MAG TPA: DNA-directed RNA polymerase subunit delta [Bacillales bacterium]|nr:DNA-directed RNA polymerase subunit delta [Bacillales bacterium]
MGLNVSKEMKKELSMVDLAFEILKAEKQPLPFQELADQIKKAKAFSKEDAAEHIARFYTNMNVDGRFKFIGENHWGLKQWYPFDQNKDDIEIPKPKRKRKKKKEPKVLEDEDYDDDNDVGADDDYEDEIEDYEDFDEDLYDDEEDETYQDDEEEND